MKHNFLNRLIRYIVVGSGVAIFQLLAFTLLFNLVGLHYQISASIAFIVTLLVSYLAQQRFTYETYDGSRENTVSVSATLFLANTVVGLLLITVVMYIGVEIMLFNEYQVQFLALAILAIYNFFFFHVVFK